MARNQRRLEMARAHAKRAYHCTCGKKVHGNGARHMHKAMHVRKGEWRIDSGHYYMTYSEYIHRQAVDSR
jgi:hypothetical protein